jgi:hypothetical protein
MTNNSYLLDYLFVLDRSRGIPLWHAEGHHLWRGRAPGLLRTFRTILFPNESPHLFTPALNLSLDSSLHLCPFHIVAHALKNTDPKAYGAFK